MRISSERKPALSCGRLDGNYGDTLRTFADGGFYAMDVAPGTYTLIVDPSQLQFLQAVQKDGPLSVTVHHSPQGDIVENLDIALTKLTPKTEVPVLKEKTVEAPPARSNTTVKALPPEIKPQQVAPQQPAPKQNIPLLKEKPAEAPSAKSNATQEAPPPEVKTPQITLQQSAPKPKEAGCTVLFIAEKTLFVIEHSKWPTKAAADEVAAKLAKRTNLPATVRKGTSDAGRPSYSVLLGAFKSRSAAEEACAKLEAN